MTTSVMDNISKKLLSSAQFTFTCDDDYVFNQMVFIRGNIFIEDPLSSEKTSIRMDYELLIEEEDHQKTAVGVLPVPCEDSELFFHEKYGQIYKHIYDQLVVENSKLLCDFPFIDAVDFDSSELTISELERY